MTDKSFSHDRIMKDTSLKLNGIPDNMTDGIFIKRRVKLLERGKEIFEKICAENNIKYIPVDPTMFMEVDSEGCKLNFNSDIFENPIHLDLFTEKVKEYNFFTGLAVDFTKPVNQTIIKMEVE